jgi:ubiquinone/menaquinone biosynthesis C-methylase UbiE
MTHSLEPLPTDTPATSRQPDGDDDRSWRHQRHPLVPETTFGHWFLRTRVWEQHVVRVALADLQQLLQTPLPPHPVILDAGCGQGIALPLLDEAFAPGTLIGVDLHRPSLKLALQAAKRVRAPVHLLEGDGAALALPDASVDVVFCHQTLHHIVDQEATLAEFHRVLKPNGHLLLAESTDAYICSWVIRLLFRHPMHVQRSAAGYLQLLQDAGFAFEPNQVSYPYLWWSRATDFGLLERWGLREPPPVGQRRETLVNVAARKIAE